MFQPHGSRRCQVRPCERNSGQNARELEPAHVELAGELLRRDEAADVGAPVRNAAEAGVDRDRHVRLQRLPASSRRRPTRGRRRSAACPRSRCGAARTAARSGRHICVPSQYMRMRAQPRRRVETVALIGPPAVDAEVEQRLVHAASSSRPAIVGGHVPSACVRLGSALGACTDRSTVPVRWRPSITTCSTTLKCSRAARRSSPSDRESPSRSR